MIPCCVNLSASAFTWVASWTGLREHNLPRAHLRQRVDKAERISPRQGHSAMSATVIAVLTQTLIGIAAFEISLQ